jgi:hypothetical protein
MHKILKLYCELSSSTSMQNNGQHSWCVLSSGPLCLHKQICTVIYLPLILLCCDCLRFYSIEWYGDWRIITFKRTGRKHYVHYFLTFLLCRSIAPCTLALFFLSFLILYTVGRTPWTGDQLFARPLSTHRTTQKRIKAHRYACLEWDSNPWYQC